MRYVRIFLLHLQQAFEQRSRSFVWFLWSLLNPLILILYWKGAIPHTGTHLNLPFLTSYYLLQLIAGEVCMSHIESDVGYIDIQEGQLSAYLLRPFSYFKEKMFSEVPFRIIRGIMGFGILVVVFLFFRDSVSIQQSPLTFFLVLLISILAYILSFTLKMILGLTAFWVTDIGGMFQLSEMLIFIFSGFILPLSFFPKPLDTIAYFLPYGYIIYFPVLAIQGTIHFEMFIKILLIQILWIIISYGIYRYLWKNGIRKFTAVGQ